MNTSKILIFGAGGLLGSHLVREYEAVGANFTALRHRDLDVTNFAAAADRLDELRPEIVINCAALCHLQGCEDNPVLSEKVNLAAPLELARLTAERGQKLVQFSTDYIFDGKSSRPYVEQDSANPLCVYGRHKAAVEVGFRAFPQHLVLRVAWLFGKQGRTFMSMLPDLLMNEETVRVAAGKRGTCLYAGWAARVIRQLIEVGSHGLCNLVHAGEMSWEGFAAECLAQLQAREMNPRCVNLIEVPLEKMAVLQGNRPLYSPLDLDLLTRKLGSKPMPWQEGVSDYLDDLFGIPTPAHREIREPARFEASH